MITIRDVFSAAILSPILLLGLGLASFVMYVDITTTGKPREPNCVQVQDYLWRCKAPPS